MPLNSEPESQRLFFALWPEEVLQEQLARLSRRVIGKRGKRIPPENLHLTLVFLGSMTKQQRVCAEAVAKTVCGVPFELRLERIGYWPRPRIVWLAPQETPKPLVELVQRLNKELRPCGHQPEIRPYRAHMTLARKVTGPFSPCQVSPLRWQVNRFCLVRSITKREGAQYQVLRAWPLVGES